ncbi:MAG: HAD-IC family P-type ATPase [Thermomicrobiales bacterium]|nr:HAD-IC family P-type ATPase [Thermomicrobiales bacterium]
MMTGLTTEEVGRRRAAGQGNKVPAGSSRTYRDILRSNLLTFINVTLIGIGIVLILLGQPRDALMSSGLAVLNALVGIIQEVIAKRRLDKISLLTRANARVIRDGQGLGVDPDELVLGDLLVTGPGDQIMLDGTIRSGHGMFDESLITGEQDQVRKTIGDPVYSGTFCVSGSVSFEAEKVGNDTLAGSTTSGARAFTTSMTPLQKDVNGIVRVLLAIAVGMLVLAMINAVVWQIPFRDMVIASAVILGIVPSGLFLMITVTYSMGAVRLANRDALVQQVNAVESLSNVDVFCTDKTGTLTTNQLQVAELRPEGVADSALKEMIGAFAASISEPNATSQALATAFPHVPLPTSAEIAFSSDRKWSAVAIDADEIAGVFALGAPEMLAPHLAKGADCSPPAEWYDRGLRVLLFAMSDTAEPLDEESATLPAGLQPAGWIALADELRPHLPETLAAFRKANVRLKIISGDNPETVAALARQAGFADDARLVSGIELEEMDGAQFRDAADSGDIFGRITPQQKERIVESLRDAGHYVAMTGDGVNDVLSVKKANLGIAMQSGSQATRAVADIVLLNDSFAAVPAAFAEGQRIRRGLQDILSLFLVRVFAVALLIAAAGVIDAGFPFAPANMTLLTLLTVGIPTFALALFARPGRAEGRIFPGLIRFVLPATLLLLIVSLVTYLGFYFLHDVDLDLLREQTRQDASGQASDALARDALTYVMVLCGLVLVPFVSPPSRWWSVLGETETDWRPTLIAVLMVPLYIAILAIPWSRKLFDIELLFVRDYILIALMVVIWTFAMRYTWKSRLFERYFGYH